MNNSHLPNRRLTLGDWQDAVIDLDLDAFQLQDFLARHPEVKPTVDLFERQVAARGYRQTNRTGYAIDQDGLSVSDNYFGYVTIFPDANGVLQYTARVTRDVADQMNKGTYVPPPFQSTPLPWDGLLKAVPWLIGGLIVLSALNTFGGSRNR